MTVRARYLVSLFVECSRTRIGKVGGGVVTFGPFCALFVIRLVARVPYDYGVFLTFIIPPVKFHPGAYGLLGISLSVQSYEVLFEPFVILFPFACSLVSPLLVLAVFHWLVSSFLLCFL